MTPTIPIGTHGRWPFRHMLRLTPRQAAVPWLISGKTGSGKSRFLAHLYVSLLEAGLSATLLDPHGDAGPLVLRRLAARGWFTRPDAYRRLLYLDVPAAARRGRYLPFNVLAGDRSPDLTADLVVDAMHRAWKELDSGSPMFDAIVDASVKTLIANQLPITKLFRLLSDKPYRDHLLQQVHAPEVLAFWYGQFDRLAPREQAVQSGSALRRAYLLLKSDLLRYSLGQERQAVDYRAFLDGNVSVIVNLAVQHKDAQSLLGSLFTVLAVRGALSRADREPAARQAGQHMILIDEFPLFTARSEAALAEMLSQTRKFGLHAVLAHQTFSQVEGLLGALQNCGILVSFGLGPLDARIGAQLLAQVEPITVSTTEATNERTTVGMNEQWEQMRQELVDLRPGTAYVRSPARPLPAYLRPFLRRPTSRLDMIHAPAMPDPAVDTAAIERRYQDLYFQPWASVAAWHDGDRPEVVPARRYSRAA